MTDTKKLAIGSCLFAFVAGALVSHYFIPPNTNEDVVEAYEINMAAKNKVIASGDRLISHQGELIKEQKKLIVLYEEIDKKRKAAIDNVFKEAIERLKKSKEKDTPKNIEGQHNV